MKKAESVSTVLSLPPTNIELWLHKCSNLGEENTVKLQMAWNLKA